MGPDGFRNGEYVVLASADPTQSAQQIVRHYRLRYQIELLIRNAKQHAGLTHCQARSQEKIDFHLNRSEAAVNLLRLLAKKAGCSRRTYRREAYNRLLIGRLFSQLDFDAEYDESNPQVQTVICTGRMAA